MLHFKLPMKTTVRHKLFFLSLIFLAGNGVLGYAVYKSNQKLLDSENWVQHTEQVIYQSDKILSIGKDIETASRGFVITNDSTFLSPSNSDEKTVFAYIGQLRQLTSDNRSQQYRIDSLDFYMNKLLKFSSKTVELRSKQGLSSAVAYTVAKQGKRYSDRIHQIINNIQQEEDTLLKQRKKINKRNLAAFDGFSKAMFISLAGFTVLLLVVIGKYLYQNKEKGKRAEELMIANKELSFQNEEKEKRAAELAIANEELSFQNEEKGKRAAELTIANEELLFQNEEKGKRAAELTLANKELSFQNKEKGKRAAELTIANEERTKMVGDLLLRNIDLEQFSYIISHNLRAPVANIIGASTALSDPELSAEDKEMLNRGINVSVMRLDSVVKDLNRILEVKSEINDIKEIVHFSTLANDIKFSIQNLIDKYSIEIKYDFSEINEFLTLRGYLYSIFYNLISNSIKYRRLQVQTLIEIKSSLAENKLELIFTDNGVGIDLKKNRGDIFGLYKRFHTHIEGKGMGLFMVKTQVEALGGKINVQSKEDKGTEFKIEFEI